MKDEWRDDLEKMVDSHGLCTVLDALAAICMLKSQHVGENWQDANLSRAWGKAGLQLDRQSMRDVFKVLP